MFDPKINDSTHQAMFLNLIFKAIKKDENVERINVFIKRLLQVSVSVLRPPYNRNISNNKNQIF